MLSKQVLTQGEVLTIIRGMHEARDSCSACNRNAKGAKKAPQVLVDKVDVHHRISIQ